MVAKLTPGQGTRVRERAELVAVLHAASLDAAKKQLRSFRGRRERHPSRCSRKILRTTSASPPWIVIQLPIERSACRAGVLRGCDVRRRGVWELPTLRLEQLLVALARRGGEPVTAIGLQHAGFELATCEVLAGLPATAATLVVESLLAECTVRPRPGLELVWTGREAGATLSRDTSQVLSELFTRAERRVIVAGFAFYEASDIFEPLHVRARDAGVEVEFFIHVDGTGQDARMSPSNFFTYSWPWRDGRAQRDNIELGVLIRDAEFASRVSGQWHALVTRGLFRCRDDNADAAP